MALTETDITLARMDLQATTQIEWLLGNAQPADGAIEFRRCLRERAITVPLAKLGISRVNTPDLMELASQAYQATAISIIAPTANISAERASAWGGDAAALNATLQDKAGEYTGAVLARTMYTAVEQNWPHGFKALRLDEDKLAELTHTGAGDRPEAAPARLTNEVMERSRRFAHSSMLRQAMVAFHHLEQGEYLPYGACADMSANSYILNSVFDIVAEHNRDANYPSEAMVTLSDVYAATLAQARYFQMHPVEQMTLVDMQTRIAEKADSASVQLADSLPLFDRAYLASAFAERAAAASGADETQQALLLAHTKRALGIKSGSTPAPRNESLNTRRDLS